MRKLLTLLWISIVAVSFVSAKEPASALSLSTAAKLAEQAIASANLPDDCYLRSLMLIESNDGQRHYRGTYKPAETTVSRARIGEESPPVKRDIIRITMDGKVSFDQEEVTRRARIVSGGSN